MFKGWKWWTRKKEIAMDVWESQVHKVYVSIRSSFSNFCRDFCCLLYLAIVLLFGSLCSFQFYSQKSWAISSWHPVFKACQGNGNEMLLTCSCQKRSLQYIAWVWPSQESNDIAHQTLKMYRKSKKYSSSFGQCSLPQNRETPKGRFGKGKPLKVTLTFI